MGIRDEILNSIAVLKSHRDLLCEDVVDTAVDALEYRLSSISNLSDFHRKQRKQVTVLFADVSGFTRMSEQMDPEEVNDFMNSLWEPIDSAISQNAGRIDERIYGHRRHRKYGK